MGKVAHVCLFGNSKRKIWVEKTSEIREAIISKNTSLFGTPLTVQYYDGDVHTYLDLDEDEDDLPPGSQLKVTQNILVRETQVDEDATKFDSIIASSEDPLAFSLEDSVSMEQDQGEPRPSNPKSTQPDQGTSQAASTGRPASPGTKTAVNPKRGASYMDEDGIINLSRLPRSTREKINSGQKLEHTDWSSLMQGVFEEYDAKHDNAYPDRYENLANHILDEFPSICRDTAMSSAKDFLCKKLQSKFRNERKKSSSPAVSTYRAAYHAKRLKITADVERLKGYRPQVQSSACSDERAINQMKSGDRDLGLMEDTFPRRRQEILGRRGAKGAAVVKLMRIYPALFETEEEILQRLTDLDRAGKDVTLCWIPSHVGIAGNEMADAATKRVAQRTCLRGFPLPASDFYPAAATFLFGIWQQIWSNLPDNKLLAIKPKSVTLFLREYQRIVQSDLTDCQQALSRWLRAVEVGCMSSKEDAAETITRLLGESNAVFIEGGDQSPKHPHLRRTAPSQCDLVVEGSAVLTDLTDELGLLLWSVAFYVLDKEVFKRY